MKTTLFILLFCSGLAHAQWEFPTYTSIGDTSFHRIDNNLETALTGFKNVLRLNGYDFHKKEYTTKDRIMYVMYEVRQSDPEHVYVYYFLRTRKGYESWFEYRTNKDFEITNDELTIFYTRTN
jgi:hypothetical protein